MQTLERTNNPNEKTTRHLIKGEYERISLAGSEWETDARVVAEMRVGGYDESGDKSRGQKLSIIDLRNTPTDALGGKVYDNTRLDSSVCFLVIDPNRLDWQADTGYKGVRTNQSVTFGRAHNQDRFPDLSPGISRNQLEVLYDQESNELIVTDLSSYGTTIEHGGASPLPIAENNVGAERTDYNQFADMQSIIDAGHEYRGRTRDEDVAIM